MPDLLFDRFAAESSTSTILGNHKPDGLQCRPIQIVLGLGSRNANGIDHLVLSRFGHAIGREAMQPGPATSSGARQLSTNSDSSFDEGFDYVKLDFTAGGIMQAFQATELGGAIAANGFLLVETTTAPESSPCALVAILGLNVTIRLHRGKNPASADRRNKTSVF